MIALENDSFLCDSILARRSYLSYPLLARDPLLLLKTVITLMHAGVGREHEHRHTSLCERKMKKKTIHKAHIALPK